MAKLKINKGFSYRTKIIFISVSSAICILSLFISDIIAKELSEKEIQQVNLWSIAMSKLGE